MPVPRFFLRKTFCADSVTKATLSVGAYELALTLPTPTPSAKTFLKAIPDLAFQDKLAIAPTKPPKATAIATEPKKSGTSTTVCLRWNNNSCGGNYSRRPLTVASPLLWRPITVVSQHLRRPITVLSTAQGPITALRPITATQPATRATGSSGSPITAPKPITASRLITATPPRSFTTPSMVFDLPAADASSPSLAAPPNCHDSVMTLSTAISNLTLEKRSYITLQSQSFLIVCPVLKPGSLL
ncbi:uncharacterized protein UHOD_11452 [Ustilago sp. UG-2017b]|nr:uncharacterized protein UHOD_11452 [Ustilago sp. UG-2017b]